MKDALDLLAKLVACSSPSGSEEAIVALVEAEAAVLGLSTERVGNSIVVFAGDERPDPIRLFLCSHLDTVPVGEGWTAPPYEARWFDGKLIGRGANDAKASGASMLWALARAASAGDASGVVVALTACEETTNTGIEEVLAELGPPEQAVIGEPTGLEVVRSQAGLAVVVAEWEGVSCHAAHAATKAHDNAMIRGAGELASFGPFASLPTDHPLLGPTTIVPTVFASGERHNVVPDSASAVIDCRIAPPYDAAGCVDHLAAALPSASLRIRSDRMRAVETPADHPLVTTALKVSGKPVAVGSNTLSDMAFLASVPAIKCGPGETSRSHTPDEFVMEEEYLAGCRFYESLVSALARSQMEVGAG